MASRNESLPARATRLLRGGWRQLTSMRTALVLLFLLALAAIPGSMLPQRNVSIEEVNAWRQQNPGLAPLVDRLGGFDVYASPWFSAIYLLLFISLLGCLVPRLRDHLRALRASPVDAPRRLSRLPQHAERRAPGEASQVAGQLQATLRRHRWRTTVRERPDDVTVSAEKGYLKETGNLLMHFAMVAVLVGVALGALYGWHGERLVVAGPDHQFCSLLQQWDEYGLGSRVEGDPGSFCFELTGFEAEFTEGGQPTSFLAHGAVSEDRGDWRQVDLAVNSPLRLDDASIYLLGNGYAPVLRYTDRFDRSQTTTAPFLPVDPRGTAEGLAAFPDANVDPDGTRDRSLQMAFQGVFLPTAPVEPGAVGRLLAADITPTSAHPDQLAPVLALLPYRGDLGIDDGIPQSVWTLDQDQIDTGELEELDELLVLQPGDTVTLDDGTTLEFAGVERWITVSVRHDPGEPVALAGAALLLVGLVASLLGRRRRVWFRVTPAGEDSQVEAGGLPRSDYPGFADEFAQLVGEVPATDAPELATRST